MPIPILASSYPLLMDLINQTYLDRVERIDGAQVDDGDNIICAATDGRKALAVRVTGNGIDIKLRGAQASAPQFAAAPSKKKNCKTGVSCGMSCISASKTCSKKTTPKQKAQKQKIVADAKSAKPESRGALVPIGGKLSTINKKTDKKTDKKKPSKAAQKSLNDLIDEKYASENPSRSDVADWVKERIKARFEPTPENIAQRAVAVAQRNLTREESGVVGVPYGKFSDKVKDRDSYAKASVAFEDWEKKKYPQLQAARRDPENWFQSIKSEGRLSETELSKTQAQVVKGSAAAVEKLARHNASVAAEPAERARAQELAAMNQARQGQSKAERLEHHKKNFDEISVTEQQEMERTWKSIQAGKGAALKDAREKALGGVIPRRESLRRGFYMPISDSDIKEHLQDLAEKRHTGIFSGDTKAEVRKQYRDLAAKYHPDNKATGDEKKFRRVTDAYNKKLEEFN